MQLIINLTENCVYSKLWLLQQLKWTYCDSIGNIWLLNIAAMSFRLVVVSCNMKHVWYTVHHLVHFIVKHHSGRRVLKTSPVHAPFAQVLSLKHCDLYFLGAKSWLSSLSECPVPSLNPKKQSQSCSFTCRQRGFGRLESVDALKTLRCARTSVFLQSGCVCACPRNHSGDMLPYLCENKTFSERWGDGLPQNVCVFFVLRSGASKMDSAKQEERLWFSSNFESTNVPVKWSVQDNKSSVSCAFLCGIR